MTDNEKQNLDRWLEWAGGEVTSWPIAKGGGTMFEARVWKDGKPFRALFLNDRYQAIRDLHDLYNAPAVPDVPRLGRCSSCPQDAAEVFKVRATDAAAQRAGITLTGPWVDTTWDGTMVREETVPLCPRCMGVELRRFLALCMDPAEWLKIVRAVGP